MIITYDTKANTLEVSHTGNHPWGTDVVAALNRHGQAVRLKGVKFGITVSADGETVLEKTWPPKGVKYSKTNQNTLATTRVNWKPDQEITVEAWCITTAGETLTASDSFTAPRPPQPYPSWDWDGTKWNAPVAYPDDGKEYQWDEDSQSWINTAININTATKDTLRSLNGVDAVRAQAIIDGRPWSSVDDLATIQGISADMIAGWNIEV